MAVIIVVFVKFSKLTGDIQYSKVSKMKENKRGKKLDISPVFLCLLLLHTFPDELTGKTASQVSCGTVALNSYPDRLAFHCSLLPNTNDNFLNNEVKL